MPTLSLYWTLLVYFYIFNGADMFHCTQLLRICDFSMFDAFVISCGTLKNEVLCVCTRKKFPTIDICVYIMSSRVAFPPGNRDSPPLDE